MASRHFCPGNFYQSIHNFIRNSPYCGTVTAIYRQQRYSSIFWCVGSVFIPLPSRSTYFVNASSNLVLLYLIINLQHYKYIKNWISTDVITLSCKQPTTNSMEQVPFWEANRSSAGQEIPRILCNPTVHYRIHNSPPLVSIPRQINPVHDLSTTGRSVLILSSHLRIGLPRDFFPSGLPTKTCVTETLLIPN